MTRPDVLYHGSSHRIEGPLEPTTPRDRAGTRENLVTGVYATEHRDVAIAVVLCKAVHGLASVSLGNLQPNEPPGQLWWGAVRPIEVVYLYTVSSAGFTYSGGQWVCTSTVHPVACEELSARDHLHLVRRLPWPAALTNIAGLAISALRNRLTSCVSRTRAVARR